MHLSINGSGILGMFSHAEPTEPKSGVSDTQYLYVVVERQPPCSSLPF